MTYMDVPLYWSTSSSQGISIALSMASISAYSISGIAERIPYTYEELNSIIPDNDMITPLIITYAMLKTDDKYAFFHVEDGSLILYAKEYGYILISEYIDKFEDGLLCDPERIYMFSPMYRDIPSTLEDIQEMFQPYIDISVYYNDALHGGLHWKDNVEKMLSLMNIESNELDYVRDILMKSIAKNKLIRLTTQIFKMYPCSIPDKESP